MRKSLSILENVLNIPNLETKLIVTESQNADYDGFSIPSMEVRSRLAKLTPKKAGYFVTHYVKNSGEPNRPYTVNEAFDTLAVCIPERGAFLFPKHVLLKHGILTSTKLGKMAFRVYLPSEINLNKTAQKTQSWQSAYYHSII